MTREEAQKKLAELVKWPTGSDGMTVDLMLRVIACDTQRQWEDKWNAPPTASPLRLAQTLAVISGVGLMSCIRALRDVDPAKADAFVKDYWLMCDAGDAFGELLWEWAEAAGLDLELLKHARSADAVDPADGIVTA